MLVKSWVRRREGSRPGARLGNAERLRFHQQLPGYRVSPLVELQLTDAPGITCLVKHEAERYGLPSFKVLGASWAIYSALQARTGRSFAGRWSDRDELTSLLGSLESLTLTCATDGNHGRAVAWMGRLLGLSAEVFVPEGTADARIRAIAGEGARVKVVDGDYDAAVHAATRAAEAHDRLLIADTSWPGYEKIPAWIAEGYGTLFDECVAQIGDRGGAQPDAIVVPIGVGSLAMAAVQSLSDAWPTARIVGVEPAGADCLTASLLADTPTTVPGPHPSVMAGLNCGTPSAIAWPLLREGLDACIVIDDEQIDRVALLMADQGLPAGETGAAAVAALVELARGDGRLYQELFPPGGTVLALCTEGVTDPDRFAQFAGWA